MDQPNQSIPVFYMPKETDLSIFEPLIGSWYESLRDPAGYQGRILSELAFEYGKTDYGKNHHASEVRNIDDFRASFPVIEYRDLNPFLVRTRMGDYRTILSEPPTGWVMTRGSTGPAKVIPVTRKHLGQILRCGARALINHVLRRKDTDLLNGRILNLNFPSTVQTLHADGENEVYGYSSGTYAKMNPALGGLSLLPKQEEIDSLGPGIRKPDWERRFELAYRSALSEDVTATMGVTPVILAFARYVRERHGKMPRELWNFHAMFCTSVRKIQFKYAPRLRKYFGEVPVVEMYSATEGVFAQQLDDLPYVSPNFDTYLLEVKTGKGMKLLHELKRGEWGRLIVSSCLFPRYDIGDMIESAGNNYFRVVGRYKKSTLLEHRLYRLFFKGVI